MKNLHIIINVQIVHTIGTIGTKWCNGFHMKFRQNFTKETFSYDEFKKLGYLILKTGSTRT